jgi:RNA ligase (TIGR02306 family)
MNEDANPLVTLLKIAEVQPHPNADRLDIISPYGDGYTWAIVARGSVNPGDYVIWFDAVNDPMVPVANPAFAPLAKEAKDGYARVKAKKLRGIISRGLAVPATDEWIATFNEGGSEALQTLLSIKKWEPQMNNRPGWGGGSWASGSAMMGPDSLLDKTKYDVDGIASRMRSIPVGARIVCTEKIHGANAAFGWLPYRGSTEFRVRSRTVWKLPSETRVNQDGVEYSVGGGMWWEVAEEYKLAEKLQAYPGIVLFGEIYGNVQDLKYGKEGHHFIAFDAWNSVTRTWMTWDELVHLCTTLDIPHVPVVSDTHWNPQVIETETSCYQRMQPDIISMSNGPTLLGASHTREGIVIRYDGPPNEFGQTREILKLVGSDYLTRK